MSDSLRRRALKGGKTVSKKAQVRSEQSSKAGSQAGSTANSRAASRVASRVASRNGSDDDEDGGFLSDDTSHSINSIDALLESDDFSEQATEVLKQDLAASIDDLLERKGSSSKSREDSLIAYDRILTSHLFGDVLYGRVDNLLAAFSKSIKSETTTKETSLALRAVALTAISIHDGSLYDTISGVLKRSISDSQDNSTKAAAIYCLGICISFGGAGDDEISEMTTYLLEVVQSDGAFIGADDDAEVVTAALHTYGFLATQIEDIEHESEDAMEAFIEQLNSGHARVQIAAGENIALLFEKSYTPREDDETSSPDGEGGNHHHDAASESDEDDEDDEGDEDDDDDGNDSSRRSGRPRGREGGMSNSVASLGSANATDRLGDKNLVKRYNAYHNDREVLEKVEALANLSSKGLNRNDRKLLHQSFASIAMTVENPRVGLTTNNASRMTVRIHREGAIKVDKWWKLMVLNTLRRLLGGGFINHYFEGNKQVLDALPVLVRTTGGGGDGGGGGGGGGADAFLSPKRAQRKGDKFKESRRFVSAGEM